MRSQNLNKIMNFTISQISHLEHAFKAEKVTHFQLLHFFDIPDPPNSSKTTTNMCVSRFRDFRSRAARTYALDNGILILFGPLLARDRPEIDFWHTFKAKW